MNRAGTGRVGPGGIRNLTGRTEQRAWVGVGGHVQPDPSDFLDPTREQPWCIPCFPIGASVESQFARTLRKPRTVITTASDSFVKEGYSVCEHQVDFAVQGRGGCFYRTYTGGGSFRLPTAVTTSDDICLERKAPFIHNALRKPCQPKFKALSPTSSKTVYTTLALNHDRNRQGNFPEWRCSGESNVCYQPFRRSRR